MEAIRQVDTIIPPVGVSSVNPTPPEHSSSHTPVGVSLLLAADVDAGVAPAERLTEHIENLWFDVVPIEGGSDVDNDLVGVERDALDTVDGHECHHQLRGLFRFGVVVCDAAQYAVSQVVTRDDGLVGDEPVDVVVSEVGVSPVVRVLGHDDPCRELVARGRVLVVEDGRHGCDASQYRESCQCDACLVGHRYLIPSTVCYSGG